MQDVRGFHSAFAVCDNDKLRTFGIGRQKFCKAVDIRFVQRRIDLVEDAEGRRLIAEQSKQQSDDRQGTLAA